MTTSAIRYATSGHARIAYRVVGDGPDDLVLALGYVSHLERLWEDPLMTAFLHRLAAFRRVIVFDRRGTGLSEPVSLAPTLEQRMDDIVAVMDSAGAERAALAGIGEGGYACTFLAASHPERTTALVVFGNTAKITTAPDYPLGVESGAWRQVLELLTQHWGQESTPTLTLFAPSHVGDEGFRRRWARHEREAGTGAMFRALGNLNAGIDLRPVLPLIRVPTLVLHRERDILPLAHGRYLAEAIPRAGFVALPGADRLPWLGDASAVIDAIQAFLSGAHLSSRTGDALGTVLVLDVGDASSPMSAHRLTADNGVALRCAQRYRATAATVQGRRLLAAFDGPVRALRCAMAIRTEAEEEGLNVRAALHVGEVELRGNDVGGEAVAVAREVATLASAGGVLLSESVAALIAGAGIVVRDVAVGATRGVQRVLAVQPTP
jgi:pimeloyl-ACP methyl ester carboxylesterase